MNDVDVLIVGGGPAGLAAAIVLAQCGVQTLVCEQRPFPVDKPCGEGIMPTGVAHLHQLGVSHYLPANSFFPFTGIRYHSSQGVTAAATFAEGVGWGIRRTTLSHALFQRAQEINGLQVQDGVRALALERTADHIVAQVNKTKVRTRLLIGADGLNSRVRRWAGLQGERASSRRWGIRQHFQISPWSKHVEVYWGRGIEAYITPCSPEQVGVALLWDRMRCRLSQRGSVFTSLLQAFPSLQTRLTDTLALDKPCAVGPLHQITTSPVSDGVLLLGDAAGYLDAITGEGISLALAQALALEKTVVPLLMQQNQPGLLTVQNLAPYVQVSQAIVRPYYQFTNLVLWLSRHPVLVEQVIRVLRWQPNLFQHLLSANMGLVSPWSPSILRRATI